MPIPQGSRTYVELQSRPVCDVNNGVNRACDDWPLNQSDFLSANGGSPLVDNFYKASNPPQQVSVGCPKNGFKNVYAIKAWHGAWGPQASIWVPLSEMGGDGSCPAAAFPHNTPDGTKYLSLHAHATATDWWTNHQYGVEDFLTGAADSDCSVARLSGRLSGSAWKEGDDTDMADAAPAGCWGRPCYTTVWSFQRLPQ